MDDESIESLREIIRQQSIEIQQLKFQQSDYNIIKINKKTKLQSIIKQTKDDITNIDSEIICLICNQILSTKDILKHSQQYKDHINDCLHIDDIKNQLSNININDNSNNIFKTRIETLWLSLKKLSATHSSYNSTINEISNHFKQYYDYFMKKEYLLKKEIQDDIDLINKVITHQINEFQLIVNIININNSFNDNNNSDDNVGSLSESDDTTDKYTISSIIESIQQSTSYNNFIENNRNTLFYNNNDNKDYKYNNFPFLNFIVNLNKDFNSILHPTAQSIKTTEKIYMIKQNNIEYDQLQMIIQESIIRTTPSIDVSKFKCDNKSMNNEASYGSLETIKWLHQNRTEGCTTDAMDNAAKNGYLEIIKWLHHNRTEGCTTDAMNNAALNGYLEIIKWLHHNRTEGCTTNAMDHAAWNGHLEIIKWLHQNRTEGCTTNAMNNAARYGHLEIIKWLHENRTEGCTTWAMNSASVRGRLEIIKWLHHNRTEGCTTDAMNNTAWGGHLEIIKWLHHNRTEGCTTDAMDNAAKKGHIETIKWLHHNRTEGCTTRAMDNAAENGHLEIVNWLHENRTEGCTTDAINNTIRSNI